MDLNLLAGALRGMSQLSPSEVRGIAGGTRVSLSLQALLPVVQSQGASTQFAQDLSRLVAQAARGLSTVFVIAPAGAGKLRIEVDRQLITVPSSLRDFIVALVRSEQAATTAAASAPRMGQTAVGPQLAPGAAANAAAAQAVPAQTLGGIAGAQSWIAQLQSGAHALVAAGGEKALRPTAGAKATAAPTIRADGPLLEAAASTQLAAQRLRSTVEHSGLFFESHLAQWSAGERSAQEVRTELVRIGRALLASGEDLATTGVSKARADAGAQRVAAQLEILQHATLQVQGQAWAGQPCTITFHEELNPDGHHHGVLAQAGPCVVSATIELDLPRLGSMQVQLRLVGHSVAVFAQTQPASLSEVRSELAQLSEALQARGLTPAALSAQAAEVP